ncbi:MAG: RNA methyltransferase [Bacteroidota bacterium]|nr:RNA methyltransferase [Bacteroidota bacterium]
MNQKLSMSELGRMETEAYKQSDKMPIVIILDNVRSLHNVGSVFRTCDAFRVEALYLCGITGTPPHKELHKTALGATETVNWKYYDDTIAAVTELKQAGYHIYCIEQTVKSTMLHQTALDGKIAFVFGNEVEGVNDDIIQIADSSIEIPQFGTKHSFNVAVTVGMILWETFRQKG